MTPDRLDPPRRTAERIDTGMQSPETSRALIVFNTTGREISGAAVYHADMPWRRDAPLPPIVVTDLDEAPVASEVGGFKTRDDERGRPDRRQISFDIHFAVTDVPANGWKTYLAWFAEDAGSADAARPLADPEAGLTVIETTRHGGDLPPRGTF